MRSFALLFACVAIVSCGNSGADDASEPPEQSRFEAASRAEKCELVAPRLAQCDNEYLVESALRASGSEELAATMEEELAKRKPVTLEQAAAIACNTVEDALPRAVRACWATTPCEAFATCVLDREAELSGAAAP